MCWSDHTVYKTATTDATMPTKPHWIWSTIDNKGRYSWQPWSVLLQRYLLLKAFFLHTLCFISWNTPTHSNGQTCVSFNGDKRSICDTSSETTRKNTHAHKLSVSTQKNWQKQKLQAPLPIPIVCRKNNKPLLKWTKSRSKRQHQTLN